MKRSRYSPRLPQAPAMWVSTSGKGNASWPAGTGVWVVNTVEARTWASAASKLAPCSMWSQIRCRATKAACPSFRCQTAGSMPIALSALTPPRPRTISCWRRRSWLPPYRRADSPRSHGAFSSRSVSSRNSRTLPARTCHTAASTVRVPSGTETMQRDPSGWMAGRVGVSSQLRIS